eukprot:7162102-Alexandrium_andersonii.AAC.1
MSASLVGSEMCIRDSPCAWRPQLWGCPSPLRGVRCLRQLQPLRYLRLLAVASAAALAGLCKCAGSSYHGRAAAALLLSAAVG